jgi:heme-degrading monooxygenase HmoA
MIARIWRGYTRPQDADTYEAMLKPDLLPGLSQVKGFAGSYLLRRDRGDEVEFITIIFWQSLEDIRAVAGDDYERAIVPDERRRVLSRWDEKAAHYEAISTRSPAA